MPLNYLGTLLVDGPDNTPGWPYVKKTAITFVLGGLLKLYFSGSSNTWERDLHSKVYIVTGGTSGIGAAVVREMAARGAQIVLLTSHLEEDNSAAVWLTEYIDDLKEATSNQMIYAEQCDLNSLYSVRKFATMWLNNRTARRLDGVICLASERLPGGKTRQVTADGVEKQVGINYLSHYLLLTLLEPALRAQPPDRDVRVIVGSCVSQSMAPKVTEDILWEKKRYPRWRPWLVYGSSKLLLNMFSREFQRRLQAKPREDEQPCNIRVNIVNPGISRSPSMRRFLSMGSIFGLLVYMIVYPFFWLFFKSCEGGMQSFMYAISCPDLIDMEGGQYIKECDVVKAKLRPELSDKAAQKELYDITGKRIQELEKRSAIERNRNKKKEVKETKKKEKKAKKKGTQKSNSDPNENPKVKTAMSETDRLRLFKSAFKEADAIPNMSKKTPPDVEEVRNRLLKDLDDKLTKSRQ